MTHRTRTQACGVADCNVAYWRRIVESGKWRGVATSDKDARLALSSAELVCEAFHRKRSTTREQAAELLSARASQNLHWWWEDFEKHGGWSEAAAQLAHDVYWEVNTELPLTMDECFAEAEARLRQA